MHNIDTITVNIGGADRPFTINTLGMYRALEGGVDPLAEFDSFSKVAAQSASPTRLMVIISKIVWCGLLAHDPSVKLEWVMEHMDVPKVTQMSPIISEQMGRFMRGSDAGEAEAPKRGKTKAKS
jgi:hypothetical protein